MDGLMDNKSIGSNFFVLEKDYEDAYQRRGGLDERMFFNGDDSLLGTSSGISPRFNGSKRKYDMLSSPVRFGAFSMGASPSSPIASLWSSPVKHTRTPGSYGAKRPSSTPFSITMTTAKWLRTMVSAFHSSSTSACFNLFRKLTD